MAVSSVTDRPLPLLHKIHAPLPAPCPVYVRGPEIGDGATPVPASLIGVSCYPGEQLTFWVRGDGGWLYSYLPCHYLSTNAGNPSWGAMDTGSRVPSHHGFAVDLPLVASVQVGNIPYRVIALVDFMDSNELLWVLAHRDGPIRVLTHRQFNATLPPGGLRKMRETWK